jgi:hypothetical protein
MALSMARSGQGAEQTIVIRPDRITADVVITPRFLVIPRRRAKGVHYAFEVVLVLQADVLLDQGKPRRPALSNFGDRHGGVRPFFSSDRAVAATPD